MNRALFQVTVRDGSDQVRELIGILVVQDDVRSLVPRAQDLFQIPGLRFRQRAALVSEVAHLVSEVITHDAALVQRKPPEHHRCVLRIYGLLGFEDDCKVNVSILKVTGTVRVPANLTSDVESRCRCETGGRYQVNG